MQAHLGTPHPSPTEHPKREDAVTNVTGPLYSLCAIDFKIFTTFLRIIFIYFLFVLLGISMVVFGRTDLHSYMFPFIC